jgi:hypothetical protein
MARKRIGGQKWALPAVLAFLALAILSRIFYNGEVLGFDYRLYYPDGICYTSHAYELSGLTPGQAWERTIADYKGVADKYLDLSQGIKPEACNSVQARILYPFFSAPFVAQLGLQGMLVVPIAALVFSFIFIYLALRKFQVRQSISVVSLLLFASSSTLLRWNISNLPESLFMFFTSISLLLVAYLLQDKNIKSAFIRFTIFLTPLIILSAFTKRSAHFWAILVVTLGVVLYLKFKQLLLSYLIGFSTLLLGITWGADRIVGKILGGQNSLWIATTTASCLKGEQVSANPANVATPLSCNENSSNLFTGILENTFKYVINEIGQLLVLDKILFLVTGFALLAFLHRLKNHGPVVYITFFVAFFTFSATLLNATLGLNFRLMVPAFPYLVACAALLLNGLWSHDRGSATGKVEL